MIGTLEKVSWNSTHRLNLEVSLYQRKDEHEYPRFVKRLITQGQQKAIWLEFEHLSTEWVDWLADEECDWLSALPNERKVCTGKPSVIELEQGYTSDLESQIPVNASNLNTVRLAMQKVVCIHGIEYITFTSCASVGGVGRVRLTYTFPKLGSQQEGVILLANRLDWSPRKMVELYLKAMV